MPRTGTWWSAFVIGLAGTILVTGIGPTMVVSLGASAIPIMVLITACGWILCLLLSEMAAMMPERAGGLPSYIYPAFKDRWPRGARHLGAFGAWGYWMGWFPVAPLNLILASYYIVDLFHLSTASFSPLGTSIYYWAVGIAIVGILLMFIPSYLGLKFGTGFATTLAILAMIPLTFLAISWIFNPSVVDFGQLTGLQRTNGSGFFAPIYGHGWFTIYIAFAFLLTWNVIAMEAAACYIGECKNPSRDAKIALNLEGGYGLFIYTLIPVAFVIVLGNSALGNSALVDPRTMFVTFGAKIFGTEHGVDRVGLADRLDADHRARALGAERDHRHGPIASPDVGGRQLPEDLLAPEQTRRPGGGHVLHRDVLDRGHVHGRRGADLHVLERRLPDHHDPGAGRLLVHAPAPAEPATADQAAGVHEVRGAGNGRVLPVHLHLRRSDLCFVHVLAGRQVDPAVLLPGVRGARAVPTPVYVAEEGRGQARSRTAAAGGRDTRRSDRDGGKSGECRSRGDGAEAGPAADRP